jgi:carbon storage regulator
MLIVSRNNGESIDIGDDVRITVCHIGNGRVRIGVDAPRDKRIVRSELPDSPSSLTLIPELTEAG